MVEMAKRGAVISVRVTADERLAVEALAAISGMAPSRYVQALLQEETVRLRPTLAAAGSLLAICSALIECLDANGVNDATRSVVTHQAQLVFAILKIHGHVGHAA